MNEEYRPIDPEEELSSTPRETAGVGPEVTPLIPGTDIIGRRARRAALLAEAAEEPAPQGEEPALADEEQISLWEEPALADEPILAEEEQLSLWDEQALAEVTDDPSEDGSQVKEEFFEGPFGQDASLSASQPTAETVETAENSLPTPTTDSYPSAASRMTLEEILALPEDKLPDENFSEEFFSVENSPESDEIQRQALESLEENPPEIPKKVPGKKPSAVSPFVEIVEIVVGALVAAILVLTLICRTGVVDGSSMVPTMHHGDRYLISDLFYTPEQGDIVVFRPEIDGEDELWIKRVIAVEGQTVYINPENYQVYVDGVVLDEPYLQGIGTIPHTTQNPITVPKGCVYVLGDNRSISHDSRYADLGCVEIGQLAGRVLVRFWPIQDFDFYL